MDQTAEYKLPIFLTKNADQSTAAGKAYSQLIKQARSKVDAKGALYLAAVTVPLDVANGNNIIVKSEDLNPEFMDSLQNHHIPVIYNHAWQDEGAGWSYPPDKEPPKILGRVYSATIMNVSRSNNRSLKAIATGQMIDDPITIDRIMSMKDYNQSVTWVAPQKTCSVCGEHPSGCDHVPGRTYNVKEGDAENAKVKSVIAVEFHRPNRAYELSFVLMPAYHDCSVEMFEKNSAAGRIALPYSYYEYTAKVQSNGVSQEDLQANALANASQGAAPTQTDVRITNSNTQEESDMDPKEILAKVEALEGAIANATKLIQNFVASQGQASAAAPAASQAAPAAPAVAPTANAGQGTGTADVNAQLLEACNAIKLGVEGLAQSTRVMEDKLTKMIEDVSNSLNTIVSNAASTTASTQNQAPAAAAPAAAAEPAAPTASSAAPAAGAEPAAAAPAAAPASTEGAQPAVSPQAQAGATTSSTVDVDVLAGMFGNKK